MHVCLGHQALLSGTGLSWGSKQAHSATHVLRVLGLAASTDAWLMAIESEICATLWAKWLGMDSAYFAIIRGPVSWLCLFIY